MNSHPQSPWVASARTDVAERCRRPGRCFSQTCVEPVEAGLGSPGIMLGCRINGDLTGFGNLSGLAGAVRGLASCSLPSEGLHTQDGRGPLQARVEAAP